MGATTFKKIDKQRYKKIYPALRKTPRIATISDKAVLLESSAIAFSEASGDTQKEYIFQSEFTAIPTVTHGVTSTSGDMVVARVIELSLTKVVFAVSAAFDGTIDIQVLSVAE